LHKWGTTASTACECGEEDQTVEHVVFQCLIHRPPHGFHGLTVVDDEIINWLLNTCPEIYCHSQAMVRKSRLNDDDEEAACGCVL